MGACTPSLFTKTFIAIPYMPGPEPGAGTGVDKAWCLPWFEELPCQQGDRVHKQLLRKLITDNATRNTGYASM